MFRITIHWQIAIAIAVVWTMRPSNGDCAEIPEEMKGRWKTASCEYFGKKDESCEKAALHITDNGIQVTEKGESWKLVITAFNSSVTPWQIDYRCEEQGREFSGKGIVRCDGGSLQICVMAGERADALVRPTEFLTREGEFDRTMCLYSRVEE